MVWFENVSTIIDLEIVGLKSGYLIIIWEMIYTCTCIQFMLLMLLKTL